MRNVLVVFSLTLGWLAPAHSAIIYLNADEVLDTNTNLVWLDTSLTLGGIGFDNFYTQNGWRLAYGAGYPESPFALFEENFPEYGPYDSALAGLGAFLGGTSDVDGGFSLGGYTAEGSPGSLGRYDILVPYYTGSGDDWRFGREGGCSDCWLEGYVPRISDRFFLVRPATPPLTLQLAAHNQRSNSGQLITMIWKTCPGPTFVAPCVNPNNSWVIANGVTGSTATWYWNSESQLLTSRGRYETTSFISSHPSGSAVIGERVIDLEIDVANSRTGAKSYYCVEGNFLSGVGVNGCLSTNSGANLINESSAIYNGDLDARCIQRFIGGDDSSNGNPRGLVTDSAPQYCDATVGGFGLYTIVQDDTATGGQLILSNGIPIDLPGTIYMTFVVADDAPDPFAFTDQTDVPLTSQITANPVVISGLSARAPVSVTGQISSAYSVNDGAFSGAASYVGNGDTITVRHTSAATTYTTTETELKVGGVTDVFRTTTYDIDTDADGHLDANDNCKEVANPTQCDSDDDGYGNHCDGDLTNNGFTNAQDTVVFRNLLGVGTPGPTYNIGDLNCSGVVNAQDTVLFRQLLGKPPGPSGLVP